MSVNTDGMDFSALTTYYQNNAIPQRYNAAIVLASVAVSVLGSYTTLLLLGRRTGKRGLRNFVLLVLAATTMASVGIWGMHFIGMHMRLEAQPGMYWYLQFNPLWTVFSLFVPLVALACVFIFLGSQDQFSWSRVTSSGVLFGGICATMHYTAAFSANLRVEYALLQTISSGVLACSAATLALIVFFKWRSQWQDNWWKRLLCATILAAGVSSMHYCAVGGTSYYVKADREGDLTAGKQTNTVMSVAISGMCGLVCLLAALVVFSDIRTARQARNKARQILVASATFDRKGNLLVTANGTLPLQVVYTSDMPQDILFELTTRQPLFQWFYSLSWNWSILDPFADRIAAKAFGLSDKGTKRALSAKVEKRMSQQPAYFGSNGKQQKKAAGLAAFRDRLLECTLLLAHDVGMSYQNMGLLFDKAVRTGTYLPHDASGSYGDMERNSDADDVSVFSLPYNKPTQEGALLILVREVSGLGQDTVDAYIGRGYRFSDTKFLAPVMADKLGMHREEVSGLLKELRVYAKRGAKPVVQPGGVYVGLFAARPQHAMNGGGIDTLVYGFARHQIPAYRLPDVKEATPHIKTWLARMMGKPMDVVREVALEEALQQNEQVNASKILSYMDDAKVGDEDETTANTELAAFQTSLYIAIDAMCGALKHVPDITTSSYLSAEVIEVPSSADDSTHPAQMIMFHTVVPAPDLLSHRPAAFPEYGLSFNNIPTFVFTPYSLFQKAQTALLRGTGAKDFARDVRKELYMRYPSTTNSPSILEEVLGTPAFKEKKRMSGLDFSPVVDRTKAFARLWEKKPEETANRNTGDYDDYTEKVPMNILESPIAVKLVGKRQSLPADLSGGILLDKLMLVSPDEKAKRRVSAVADDIFRSGGSSVTWVTPPPAFPASAVMRTPPSFPSTPLGSGVAREAEQASRALMTAMGTNAVSPTGSLPGYPATPPAVATPPTAITRPSIRLSSPVSALNLSRRQSTISPTSARLHPPLPQPLAAAARLRSDGWYERTMGEIEHSDNARELFKHQQWLTGHH